jgi:hypothetical protein
MKFLFDTRVIYIAYILLTGSKIDKGFEGNLGSTS